MKRFLLPASALVLVVTACGAGARPAPRATQMARWFDALPFVQGVQLLGVQLIQVRR